MIREKSKLKYLSSHKFGEYLHHKINLNIKKEDNVTHIDYILSTSNKYMLRKKHCQRNVHANS